MRGFLKRLQDLVSFLESTALLLLLLAIISLAVADIFMRNFFDSGISLAQPVVRILVLWIGLLGALYATRDNKHITVDVLARLLPPKARLITRSAASLFAASVCMMVAWHGFRFVHDSFTYGDTVLGNVPAWIVQVVIPASFMLISVRFIGHGISYFVDSSAQSKQDNGQS